MSNEELSDRRALHKDLTGSPIGSLGLVASELIYDALDHRSQIKATAAVVLSGIGMALPAEAAAAAQAPTHLGNSTRVETIEAVEPPGATLWALKYALAKQAGISPATAEAQILKLNHGVDPLMHERSIVLPRLKNDTLARLEPGQTIYSVAEAVADQKHTSVTNETTVIEDASGITSETEAEELPVGFAAVVPNVSPPPGSYSIAQVEPQTPPTLTITSSGGIRSPIAKNDTANLSKKIGHPKAAAKPAAAQPNVVSPTSTTTNQPAAAAETTPPAPVTTATSPPPTAAAPPPPPPAPVAPTAQAANSLPTKIHHHRKKIDLRSECTLDSHAPLVGGDREFKLIHYLMICNGDSLAAATGVAGNLEQEDTGFDPLRIENDGGDSRNPANAGGGGWGIAQWTPGVKAKIAAEEFGIHKIYKFRRQVELVAAEMKSISPTGAEDINATIKTMTSASEAAAYFEQNFEAPKDGGDLPNRESMAVSFQNAYNSLHPPRAHHHRVKHHRHHARHNHTPTIGSIPTPISPATSTAPTYTVHTHKHHHHHRHHKIG